MFVLKIYGIQINLFTKRTFILAFDTISLLQITIHNTHLQIEICSKKKIVLKIYDTQKLSRIGFYKAN